MRCPKKLSGPRTGVHINLSKRKCTGIAKGPQRGPQITHLLGVNCVITRRLRRQDLRCSVHQRPYAFCVLLNRGPRQVLFRVLFDNHSKAVLRKDWFRALARLTPPKDQGSKRASFWKRWQGQSRRSSLGLRTKIGGNWAWENRVSRGKCWSASSLGGKSQGRGWIEGHRGSERGEHRGLRK